MNEFYGEDGFFHTQTLGVTDYGIKIQGTTRNPDNYNAWDSDTDPWVWSWAGVSDVVFNKARASGVRIDAAIKERSKSCTRH